MIRGIWARKRRSSATTQATTVLDRAARPVLEQLEARQLMSASGVDFERHSFMGAQLEAAATPAATSTGGGVKAHSNVSKATIALRPTLRNMNAFNWSGNQGWTVAQIRHLYGLDMLDAPIGTAPLYTNTGEGQNIAIIGSDPGFVFFNHWTGGNGSPIVLTPGNLAKFNTAMNLSTVRSFVTLDDTLIGGQGPGDGPFPGGPRITDFNGQDYTQGLAEWVAAMAPQANTTIVAIPTTNTVATTGNLLAGIQQAITDLAAQGGGTCIIPFTTNAEDPTIQAQYDALFAQGTAQGVNFVAAAGDNPGVISMPAVSPYVTSVGGTVINMDAAGNRNSETAWLRGGGGPSSVEGMPSYQVGIVPTVKGKKARRGTPDVSLAAIGRATGYGFYTDDTPDATSPLPWSYAYSTSFGAAVFGGMVADVGELRYTLRQAPIVGNLNQMIYNAYKIAPKYSFTDITVGNNLHQAGIGYDFATGLGVPKMDGLIPSLGGVVGTDANNLSISAQFINTTDNASSGINLTTPFTGTGSAQFGPFNVGVGFATLVNKFNTLDTADLSFPLLSRNLDNTVTGQGTAVVHIVDTDSNGNTITTNATLPIYFSGAVTRSHKRYVLTSGSVYTIDANGNRVAFGANQVFQGSVKSI